MITFNEILAEMPHQALVADVPMRTDTYQPVSHTALIEYLSKSLDAAGLEVVGAKYSADSTGNKLVGTLEIGNSKHEEFGMQLGFRNSYDRSMSVGLASGGNVFVCSNGMFQADLVSLRKHTPNMGRDMDIIMQKQIVGISDMFQQYAEDIEIMQESIITKDTMHEIVGRMFIDEKIITGAQLNIIRKEINVSENFKMLGHNGNMSLWNMYQNTTQALKKSHTTRYFSDHSVAHNLMLDYV